MDPALPPVPVLEATEDAVADAAPPRRRLLPPPRVVVSAVTGDAKARKSTRSRKPQCIEGDNPDIEALGENRFRVARDLVDHYTDDLAEAARLAAVYWHEDAEGKVDGFRIRRIKCGSVLYEAGLRNGDVIHTVNGRPVRNIPQALVAYRKLRKKRSLQLELTREGGSLELHYKLT